MKENPINCFGVRAATELYCRKIRPLGVLSTGNRAIYDNDLHFLKNNVSINSKDCLY